MNEHDDKSRPDLNALRTRYREIEAPPRLATRIRAEVRQRAGARPRWRPAFALAGAAAAALVILPLALQRQPSVKASLTSPPSISAVKPSMTSLGLSRVRSVRTPAIPPKPRPEPAVRPQTNFEIDDRYDGDDRMEEKTHV